MCRHGSSALLLLSALCLLLSSASSWADDYQGPVLPEGWYPISASELTELETTLARQAETIERQRQTLTTLDGTLTRLSTTIERQATTISGLGTSFEEYASAAEATARSWRWATLAAAVVAVLAVVF